MITARAVHAYPRRPGEFTQGVNHAVLDQPLDIGRLHREAGDALCKPADKFWGLDGHGWTEVTCQRCLMMMERYGVRTELIA